MSTAAAAAPAPSPLVEELASALNAVLLEVRWLQHSIQPRDPSVLEQAQAAIARYDLERDRTDLDCATLPLIVAVTIQHGDITWVGSNAPTACEIVLIDYDTDGLDTSELVKIPQGSPGQPRTIPALAYTMAADHSPGRVLQLHRAVETGSPHPH